MDGRRPERRHGPPRLVLPRVSVALHRPCDAAVIFASDVAAASWPRTRAASSCSRCCSSPRSSVWVPPSPWSRRLGRFSVISGYLDSSPEPASPSSMTAPSPSASAAPPRPAVLLRRRSSRKLSPPLELLPAPRAPARPRRRRPRPAARREFSASPCRRMKPPLLAYATALTASSISSRQRAKAQDQLLFAPASQPLHRAGPRPACSDYVAIVRIRSTTLVRLLHGLDLLPNGISGAGTGNAMI